MLMCLSNSTFQFSPPPDVLTDARVPSPPLERRHFLGRLLLEFGQRAVLLEAFVVQQLTHGDVSQLLRQLKGLADVQEDGEDVLLHPGVDLDRVGQQEGGALLQLGDLRPTDHQLD